MTPNGSVAGSPSFRRADPVLSRQLVDGVVLLPPDGTAEPVALNDTGREVWEAFAEGATVDETVAALATGHGLEPSTIADAVAVCVHALVARGLLLEADTAGAHRRPGAP